MRRLGYAALRFAAMFTEVAPLPNRADRRWAERQDRRIGGRGIFR